MHNREYRAGAVAGDVRLRGFADRAPVEAGLRWVDETAAPLPAEEVGIADAADRVLAIPIVAARDLPPADCAAVDGYALRAADTIGAGDYNPLPFALNDTDRPLAPLGAALIAAGLPLPRGADAVAPFAAAQAANGALQIQAAVAEGSGIERRGRQVRGGTPLFAAGRRLRAQELALLSLIGLAAVAVVRRPRVALRLAGPKPVIGRQVADADGPMLRRLIARDGGVVTEGDADVILCVGRTGTGPDDDAPVALAAAGELVIHGIALNPGGSTGMGRRDGAPVILLPGEPLAALTSYEFFAGRLIRRLGGRMGDFPHPVCEAELTKKIVSAVGLVEIRQVLLCAGRATVQGSAEEGGILGAVRADGFVVIPAACEGYAPGARVTVRLYER